MSLERDRETSIHACDRCRKRKAKCIPSCHSCQAAGAICASTDSRTRQTVPRSQIVELEEHIHQLHEQLRQLGVEEDAGPNTTRVGNMSTSLSERDSTEGEHHPDLIRVESGGDGHFLGASSGLYLARSVLESARKNSNAFEEQDRSAPSGDSHEPTESRDSMIDSDGAITEIPLPSWETVTRLAEIFFRHYEIQYPILEKDKFMKDASNLYFSSDPSERGCGNPWIIFMLNMVISISLTFIDDADSTKLCDRFRRNATSQLNQVMQTKSHQTLQCLLLLLLSSTLGSRSAPMWYISGICMRMCVDLGYHREKTIWYGTDRDDGDDNPDTKRRLFWVTYTFDRSLAKMLGRPFFIDDEKIDVTFPTTSLPDYARLSVHHWLTMQRIQSEIVSNVYVMDRSNPQATSHESRPSAWITQTEQKLHVWFDTARQLESRGKYTAEWWEYWYQHARLMLNQPKPRATKKSLIGAFDAAETMVRLSFIRAHRSVTEFSWLDIHLQLVSGLTMLFLVLKSPPLRERAQRDWVRFKGCVIEWEVVLAKLEKRWSSMAKMKSVLSRLADGVMQNIENNKSHDGNRRHRHHSPRRERHESRLAMEELIAPVQLTKTTRSPRSISQAQRSPRKRRRGIGTIEGGLAQEEDISPSALDPTPPSIQHLTQQQTENDFYPWLSGSETNIGLTENTNFPSVLGNDLFTDIDQLGAPLQLDLGIFDPPADFMANSAADPFGFQWMGGRLDNTLTESVLNFRGNLEEPTQAGGGTYYPEGYQ
ncbi:fungal specific transcription factor domain-containing protein [Sarocladium implicatum]|nr:fungal specific transcription factor domain-containing protein [Sarocladium implicatum]